jgi:hypothetical protein
MWKSLELYELDKSPHLEKKNPVLVDFGLHNGLMKINIFRLYRLRLHGFTAIRCSKTSLSLAIFYWFQPILIMFFWIFGKYYFDQILVEQRKVKFVLKNRDFFRWFFSTFWKKILNKQIRQLGKLLYKHVFSKIEFETDIKPYFN